MPFHDEESETSAAMLPQLISAGDGQPLDLQGMAVDADDEIDEELAAVYGGNPPTYLPTPDEILRVTREIRSEWDAFTEKQRRFGPSRIPWNLPRCTSHG